ncbi:ATP-dependent helicase [bacterium]|nr:ATP-dependent helicase [bacterium]
MNEQEKEKILDGLNKEQEQAVKAGKGPIMIVAGAGTGKTTVITKRILNLILSKNIAPEEILALTFTEKAAQEMIDRVNDFLPIGYADFWISTFHSFCERILKEHGLDVGISTDFKILDDTQAWILVKQNLDKFKLDYYRPLGNPTKFINALLKHFSKCKDEAIYPEDYLEYSDKLRLNMDGIAQGSKLIKSSDKKEIAAIQQEADRIKEIANAYSTYQRLLSLNNFLDFGDLINYTLKLFEKRPLILKSYQKQFKYVLIDEFQDTNWTQYELVKLISKPRNNITVCADDDQSIYMWRGSSFSNVLRFREDYPNLKEIVLIRNYRSSQNILDISYSFIQKNNPNRLEYQLSKVNKIVERAKEKGISLKNLKKINKKLIAEKNRKGIIEVMHFSNAEEEAKRVIEKIIYILNKDKETTPNDFAILVRANRYAKVFCQQLERAGVSYQFLASSGLYSKPVILDIMSYLKILLNYYDDKYFFRILNLPFLKLPYEEIAKISQYSFKKGQPIYETLNQISVIPKINQSTVTKINFLLSLLKKHSKAARERNVSEVFILFLEESGYLEYLTKEKKDEKDFDLINQFYDKIKKFEQAQIDPNLNNFIEQIDLEIDSGEEGKLNFDLNQGPDMVNVMTIHAAKGLEFDYVFLPSLVEKRFPSINKKEPIEIPQDLTKEITPEGNVHLQEERRLFYVGITRAKKGVFFSWADNYGGARKTIPSRFLFEAGLYAKENKADNLKLAEEVNIIRNKEKIKKKINAYNNLQSPLWFSFTQLCAFEKCPLQYKFAHILKVPRVGSPVFSFGKTMHNTLYEFLKLACESRNKRANLNLFKTTQENEKINKETNLLKFEDLISIYKKNWIDQWYRNKEEKEKYFNQGKKSLKLFYDDYKKTNPKIKFINQKPALEQSFNLKLGKYLMIGRIDRIDDLGNGKVELIDYKTGKSSSKITKESKEQLLIYQIAAEEVFNLKPEKLTCWYLNDNKKISFIGNDDDKIKIKEKIIKIIKEIEKGNFAPKPSWECKSCDFRNICEYRQF